MKKILIKTFFVSLVFLGTGYFVITVMAALSQVTSGTPLTATTWNDMISNFFWKQNGSSVYYTGNVGIGTTNPIGKLQIDNQTNNINELYVKHSQNNGGYGGSNILIENSDTGGYGDSGIIYKNPVAEWYAGVDRSDGSKFKIGSNSDPEFTNVLTLNPNGTVGIGTNTPNYALHINGNGFNNAGISIQNNGTGGQQWSIYSTNNMYAQGAGKLLFYNNNNASSPMVIQSNGYVGIGATHPTQLLHVNGTALAISWSTSSDQRYKKEIKPIENALEKVLNLNGVEYKWRVDEYKEKHFGSGENIGFIAQEVEKVLPELVTTDKDGYKSMKYAEMTAVLVEAIKELKKENNLLKLRIENLENK